MSRYLCRIVAGVFIVAPMFSLAAQQRTSPPAARRPLPAVAPRPDTLRSPRAEHLPLDWDMLHEDFRSVRPFEDWDEYAAHARSLAREAMDGVFPHLAVAPISPLSPLTPLAPPVPPTPPTPLVPMAPLAPLEGWSARTAEQIDVRFQRPFGASHPSDFSRDLSRAQLRAPWLQGDPADSIYRVARELLNKGEYRRAALAFRDLSTRMPTSGYAADALYWQAFALYRMGGTPELRGAIEALEEQKAKYPGARLQAESATLALRIRGALASRGDAAAAALVRTAAGDSALRCDREEQAIRAEALNALSHSDPDGAIPILQRTLARRDSCSAPMRRTAVFLIGNKRRDASGVAMLSKVAREDPATDVRTSAVDWLARAAGDDALATLEELARDTADMRVQQAAVRALVRHPSARARQLVRGLVDRSDTPERLRLEALGAFDKERATADDVAWMRALYARTDNARVKARIVNTLASIGGADVDQWMLAMARNTDESSDARRYAVRRVGRTLPIAELARLYDSAAERPIREVLIETLAQRAEGEATDKLLDIVKSGTDPHLRSRAISALTQKKDPRTLRLLMEIIDK